MATIENAARKLADEKQWAASGLMIGAARMINVNENKEEALSLAHMAKASALGENAKDIAQEAIELIKEMPEVQWKF